MPPSELSAPKRTSNPTLDVSDIHAASRGVTAECADNQGGRFYPGEFWAPSSASGLAIRMGVPSCHATTASMVSE